MTTLKVQCAGCRQAIDVPAPQPAKIVNFAAVSMVVLEHPEQAFCPHCKTAVVAGIGNMQLAVVGLPLSAQDQKSVILAPNGMAVN